MNSIIYKDREVRYSIFGNGTKTMVIFPGVSLVNILDSINSIKQAYKLFLDEYSIIIFERPLSKDINYSISDLADERIYVLDKLNIKDAYLLSISQGGMVGLEVALKRNDIFKKMVIASSCAQVTDSLFDTFRYWIDLSNKKEKKELIINFYKKLFTDKFISDDNLNKLVELIEVNDEDYLYFIVACKSMYNFNVLDRLKDIKTETLVIGAEYDTVFYKEASIDIANELNSELYIYDGYKHGVYDEANDFKQKVYDFFAK